MLSLNTILLILSFVNVCKNDVIFDLEEISNNCTCVPYYTCSFETGDVITDGTGLLEARKLSGECTGYFDVCCNVANIKSTEEASIELKGCGYHKPEISSWSGILLFQDYETNIPKYKCGVSLIHKQVALTAAHCIVEGILTIKIGNIKYTIKKIIVHPKFNFNTLQNDLALLILNNPISASDVTEFICIPPPGMVLENMRCIVATHRNSKVIERSKIFKSLKVHIMSKQQCLNALRKTRLGIYFELHKSFICARGEENKDICNGDGGSPLVCSIPNQPGRYHQAGIVSWGIGCGDSNIPSVYVNLPIFRQWLDDEMQLHGFDINSYRY